MTTDKSETAKEFAGQVELTAEAAVLTRDERVWLWGFKRHWDHCTTIDPKTATMVAKHADVILGLFRERFPQEGGGFEDRD